MTESSGDNSRVDDALWRFEEAWKWMEVRKAAITTTEPPDLADFVPQAGCPDRRQTLIELIKVDLEYRWRWNQGQVSAATLLRKRAENYFREWPELAGDNSVYHELLLAELAARTAAGDHLSPEERRLLANGEITVDHRKPKPRDPLGLSDDSLAPPESADLSDVRPVKAPPGKADRLTLPCMFGSYELLEELGAGGMGVVYRARQIASNKIVALKLIRSELLSRFLPAERAHVLARFRREAEAAGRLDHDHIVTVYHVDEFEGQPYYTMRYVDGRSLREQVNEGPLEPKRAAKYVRHIALALAATHKAGILHRDLKPHNVMLDTTTDRALLTDFGLAKLTEGNQQLTATGHGMGSPPYMSPEQAKDGGKVTELSDIYGVGATLYHLLTGRPPFLAADATQTIIQVLTQDPVSPRVLNPLVPIDLETVTLHCLWKEPAHRYSSAQELADDLGLFLEDKPVKVRPVGRVERTWRWCRRNPAVAGLAVAVVLVLITGTIVSLLFAVEANRQANLAKANERLADDRAKLEEEQRKRAADEADKARQAERRAITSEALAQQKTKDATREAENAKTQLLHARKSDYASKIGLAQRSLRDNDLGDAELILNECSWDLRGWEHSYLWTQLQGKAIAIKGHSDSVYSVAFSSDGRRIVSGSRDSTLKVWDAATGQEILTLVGHSRAVNCVAVSSDGRRIVSGSVTHVPVERRINLLGEVKVWDATTGQEVLTFNGHASEVKSIAFSPDGRRIATGSSWYSNKYGEVKVWDASTGQELLTLKGHQNDVSSVAFSPDGRRIVSGGGDNWVNLWDTSTGQKLLTIKEASGPVAFSPDARRIVSDSGGNTLKVWDAASGQQLLTLKGHSDSVTSVVFSPDGRRIVSGSNDGRIKLWDADTGQEVLTINGRLCVLSVAFSPDSRRIVSGGLENRLRVWNVDTAPEALTLNGHTKSVKSVAFSPDGRRIVSGSDDKTLMIWDGAVSRMIVSSMGDASDKDCVAISPDGRRIVSGGRNSQDGLKMWDVDTGQQVQMLRGHTNGVFSVAYSPEGRRIVSGSGDGTLNIWDADTGQEVLTLKGHRGPVHSVAFSPDSLRIASAGWDGTLKIWDVTTGKDVWTLKGHSRSGVLSLAFSADGLRIVSGGADGTLKVCDADTGQELLTLKGDTNFVWSVAFSPDGQRIVSGSADNTLKCWDAATGEETLRLKGHTGEIRSVVFSPDGRRIVSGSDDTTIKVWDAGQPPSRPDEQEKPPFQPPRPTKANSTPDPVSIAPPVPVVRNEKIAEANTASNGARLDTGEQMESVYHSIRISNAHCTGRSPKVGNNVIIRYELKNTLGKELHIPVNHSFGRPLHLVGVHQHWIEREGNDSTITAIPKSVDREGRKYSAGGGTIESKPALAPGKKLEIERQIETAGFLPGKYLFHIEYKKVDHSIIQTVVVPFELRTDNR